jgi:hypothetical protein
MLSQLGTRQQQVAWRAGIRHVPHVSKRAVTACLSHAPTRMTDWSLPPWSGSFFSCILPKELTQEAPVTDGSSGGDFPSAPRSLVGVTPGSNSSYKAFAGGCMCCAWGWTRGALRTGSQLLEGHGGVAHVAHCLSARVIR